MTKLAPEWVRTSDPVIRSPARYRWTTAPAAKLGQADAGDNEAKLMTKLAPEWVRTSDPVIRSPARYRWTTAPALRTRRESPGLR